MKTNNIWIVIVLNSLLGILFTMAEPTIEIITTWEKEYIRLKVDSLVATNKSLVNKLQITKEENVLLKEEVNELKKEVNVNFIIILPWLFMLIIILIYILRTYVKIN